MEATPSSTSLLLLRYLPFSNISKHRLTRPRHVGAAYALAYLQVFSFVLYTCFSKCPCVYASIPFESTSSKLIFLQANTRPLGLRADQFTGGGLWHMRLDLLLCIPNITTVSPKLKMGPNITTVSPKLKMGPWPLVSGFRLLSILPGRCLASQPTHLGSEVEEGDRSAIEAHHLFMWIYCLRED